MSSSIDTNEAPLINVIASGWTSSGKARSRFAEGLTDDSLKNQIASPILTESLLRMRKQFAEIQMGSEYFFQALDFLNWTEPDIMSERPDGKERFHVLLSSLLLMRKANISGSTCIPCSILQTQISASLLNSGFSANELSPEKWQKWLLTSYGTEKDPVPDHPQNAIFTVSHSLLYFSKYWQAESRLLSLLRKRIKMNLFVPDISLVEKVLETVLVEQPVIFGKENLCLDDDQKAAVLLSISSPLLIITGGPGTGKTSVVVTLLRVLKRLGLAERPALAAPTGRAAKRMSESVFNSLNSIENLKELPLEQKLLEDASETKTLHRLLAYRPSRHSFKHHEYDPLEHDLLIVDEGSMIDQEMMSSLLSAANSELPHQSSVSRIIILGDAQQLPSVGNGAVLLELTKYSNIPETAGITENQLHIVKLQKSYRQEIGDAAGRNILGVAETVKEMEYDPSPELLFNAKAPNHEIIRRLNSLEEVEKEKVFLLNQTNTPAQLGNFARWWVVNYLSDEKFLYEIQQTFPHDASGSCATKLDYLFSYLKHFRVLTATQVLPSGAVTVNQQISECWLAENGTKDIFSEHYPGEPVMVTKNNYRLQLFNGDQGIFLKFINPESREVELKAVFPIDGEFKTFYQYELHQLQTAYAITVHKSQGSEYDHLALILPALRRERWASENVSRSIEELMSREMLYTALTRAKKSVLILGEQSVLEAAALYKVSRYSGIGAALAGKEMI